MIKYLGIDNGHSTYRCGNYSREETIQGRKLFAEIRYLNNSNSKCMPIKVPSNPINIYSVSKVYVYMSWLMLSRG